MSNAIFDLEQEILDCWRVVDDINDIYKFVGDDSFFEGMDPKHTDKIMNLMLGLTELYSVKFDRTFRTFETVCREYHQANKEVQRYQNEKFINALDAVDDNLAEQKHYAELEKLYTEQCLEVEQLNERLRIALNERESFDD